MRTFRTRCAMTLTVSKKAKYSLHNLRFALLIKTAANDTSQYSFTELNSFCELNEIKLNET